MKDLKEKFGEPIHEMTKSNNTWLLFESSLLAAGPIRARVNPENNEVLELRCTEDGPSQWKVDSVK